MRHARDWRRCVRDSITALKRLLPSEAETFDRLERSYLDSSALSPPEPAWHECARKLALEYFMEIAPVSGWGRDAVPVCFIEKALAWIGVPAGEKFSRSAIANVVSSAQCWRKKQDRGE
jgi:hypothetical protein